MLPREGSLLSKGLHHAGAVILAGRHALPNVLLGLATVAVAYGGAAVWGALVLALLLGCLADEMLGDEPALRHTPGAKFALANLHAAAPLLLALTVAHWLLARRTAAAPSAGAIAELVLATLLVGYLYALVGATVGHELVHRAKDRTAQAAACLLLGLTFNTGFMLYHRSHHRDVGLLRDAATARRGETCLRFILRTIAAQTSEAFRVESDRLRRRGSSILSPRNRLLRLLMWPLGLAVAAGFAGGSAGLAVFMAGGLIGRVIHETVNYVQHYGLVRIERQPVEARHTWNCNRLLSNALQFNLPYHAFHHLAAARPYWRLTTRDDAPMLPHGYQTMALIALVPALWRRTMRPALTDWDRRLATGAERRLLQERGWDKLA